jgi:hypothetical protein
MTRPVIETVAAIAAIDIATCDGNTRHALDLGKRRCQRVTVIGIARQCHLPRMSPSRLVVAIETLTPNS